MGRLPNTKYWKLAHVIIISDTEILNLKARSRSNRLSLKQVKNSQNSSVGCNYFDTQHCFLETPFVYLPSREIESLLSRT